MDRKKTIVNASRSIDKRGGVSGVAYALDKAFSEAGYNTATFTVENSGFVCIKFRNIFLSKLWLFLEVVWASTIGSVVLAMRFPKSKYFVISHNDFLYGQVYVNHGLHRAMIARLGRLKFFLRNPIHLFIFFRESIRHAFGFHSYIVCSSLSQKNEFSEFYSNHKSKIKIIPNGIDFSRFKYEGKKSQNSPYEESLNKKYMVFVGYEFDRKGLKYAIQSLSFLPDLWEIIVVGGDSYQIRESKKNTDSSLVDRVHYLGVRYDLDEIYRSANCFVLPSKFEAMCLVSLEAAACGLPVVMSSAGASREVILDGVNGYICVLDPRDIANKVELALGLDREVVSASVAHYGWDVISERYIEECTDSK
ncbi:glycosyltransferase family 4 protein [Teredinibacter haidensis]|uniref:glycosyltransferase family 4 protein n=1 Tax=Teredinibacter haidensis TaxID=2731755 RepID=UPI000948DD38|nr:glycosyltransferase [Teredinibacter haidensis]